MSEYITKLDDTFDNISRIKYGSESSVDLIRAANPGLSEPLPEGVSVVIPDTSIITGVNQVGDVDEVSLYIEDKIFRFWTVYKLSVSFDGFSSVEFSAPFESADAVFREIFRPFAFNQVFVAVGDEIKFHGYMLPPTPHQDSKLVTVNVAAYSRAAVMTDCSFSGERLDKFSLNNQKLSQIANLLCGTLGLNPVFLDDDGPAFEEVALDPDENALQFLKGLAQQRNLVITDNADGQPVFHRSTQGKTPVAFFDGSSPDISIRPNFNGQTYYSHITALAPVDPGFDGSKYTVKNSRLTTVIRPFNFKAGDTEGADTKAAADAKMGRMFAAAATYEIDVITWRDKNVDLWLPGEVVTVLDPDAMIYRPYDFLIRGVDFFKTPSSKTATLSVVFPGSLNGHVPEVLPWEE